MDIERTTRMRYLKVLEGLKEHYVIKAFLAALGWIGVTLQEMFTTQIELVVLLMIVIIVDFITGNINARRQNIPIVSFGWRQSVVKTIEYTVFLAVLVAVGNTFSGIEGSGWVSTIFTFTQNIEVFGFFFIIMTEIKSIAENLTGNSNALKKLFDQIMKRSKNDTGIDV